MKHTDPQRVETFTDYVREHQSDFYRLAFSYVHDQDAALDVVQEALEKALRGLGGLRQPEYMRTWFYRILVNESLTSLRRRKHEVLPLPELLDSLPAREGRDSAETLDLYAAIDKLEPKLKTVVMLRFFEDMKFSEISLVTGTNINTVKSRLSAALRRLRLSIEEEPV